MNTARLDTGFLARTAVVVVALAAGIHLVHAWQRGRHARGQLARADQAERSGDRDEEIASLSRYLAFAPSDRAVRLRYATTLADEAVTPRSRRQALRELRRVLRDEPEQLDAAIKAAKVALALKEPAEAGRFLAQAINRHPRRAELHEMLARAQADSGQVPAAARSLELALQIEPERVSSAERLARLLRERLQQPRRATLVLDRLVKDNPRSAEALVARARHRAALGKLDAARDDLAGARKLAPRDPSVLSAAAENSWQRGDYREAAGHWRRLLEERPDSVSALLALTRAEREGGRPERTIAALRAGLGRRPNQPDLLFTLADLLLDRGEGAEARKLLSILPKSGAKGKILYLQGRIQEGHRLWPEAVGSFTRATGARDLPADALARLLLALARCHAETGARDEQAAAVRLAVRIDPTPTAKLALARLLVEERVVDAALPLLRSLVKLPAPPAEAWELLARALLEENLARPAWQRSWKEIEDALDRASRSPSSQGAAALLRADMHVLRDEPEQARKVLSEARRRRPDEPLLWKAEADLALRQGDEEAALEILARADRALSGRVAWLLLRAERAARLDAGAAPELERLESAAARLKPDDRDRLEQYLAQVCQRRGDLAALERLCAGILKRHPADLPARRLLLEGRIASGEDAGAKKLIAEMRRVEGEDGTWWRSGLAAFRLGQAARGDRTGLPEARALIREVVRRRPGWSHGAFLAGRLDDLEGKPEQALENYRKVLQRGDYHPVAVRRAVQLLSSAGRFADANQVLEVVQWHGALEGDLLRPAASIALRAGKAERAAALARLVLAGQKETKDPRDLAWLARLLEAAGRTTEAEAALGEAVRAGPDATAPWLAWLAYLTRQGRTEDAEATLTRMRKEVPPDRLPLGLGQAYEVLRRPGEAERTYRGILSADPRDAQALLRLLDLYLRGDRNAEAERVLERLLGPDVLVPEEQMPELRRRLALVLTDPRRRPPLVERALALLAINRAAEGETAAHRRVAALVRAGVKGQRAQALRTLERLPKGQGLSPLEQLRLAWAYDATGDWPRARGHLLDLLETDGGNTAWMAILIDGLLRHGKRAEAGRWLERLAKREPDTARTRQLQERFEQLVRRPTRAQTPR
jgi:tetratricopeptide (TPR) repeat protein